MTLAKFYDIQKLLKSGKRLMDIPLRVVFYARVSTKTEEQKTSLDSQVLTYRKLISDCPNWEFAGEYTDRKSAKTIKARKGFQRMMDDARADKFDLLIVKEVSRYGRDVVDSVQSARELVSLGVAIYSVIDSLTSFDDDFEERLAKLSIEAQTEISRMSRRIKMGMNISASEKKSVLGNSSITGYKKARAIVNDLEIPVLEIVPEEATIVKRIFNLYANQKLGFSRIQKILFEEGICSRTGKPVSVSTLRYILTNPKYKGTYCSHRQTVVDYRTTRIRKNPEEEWIMFDDVDSLIVPAIIDPQLWEKANALYMEKSSRQPLTGKPRYRKYYPMTGLLICDNHNKPLQHDIRDAKTDHPYGVWQCKHRYNTGAIDCHTPAIYDSEILKITLEALEHALGNLNSLIPQIIYLCQKHSQQTIDLQRISDLEIEQCNLQTKLEKLVEGYLESAIPKDIYLKQKETIDKRSKEIQAELSQLKTLEDDGSFSPEVIESLTEFIRENLPKCVDDYELTHALIDKIVVKPGDTRHSAILDLFLTSGPGLAYTKIIRHARRKRTSNKDSGEDDSPESLFMDSLLDKFGLSTYPTSLSSQPASECIDQIIRNPAYKSIIGLYTECLDLALGHTKAELVRRGAGQENYYIFTYYVRIHLNYLQLGTSNFNQSVQST